MAPRFILNEYHIIFFCCRLWSHDTWENVQFRLSCAHVFQMSNIKTISLQTEAKTLTSKRLKHFTRFHYCKHGTVTSKSTPGRCTNAAWWTDSK